MDIDMELLITLVESKPVLWDKPQECYKKRQSTFAACKEICMELNKDFENLSDKEKNDFGQNIIKKWNNARDNWMKYHTKMKESKSGSGAKILRKYKYYEQMKFLSKIVIRRIPEASIPPENDLSQSYNKENEFLPNNKGSATATPKKNKKRKTEDVSEVDQKMLTLIKSVEDEDKNKSMSFFKSIAPIVDKYCDEDYIEFQYEVIKVMRKFTWRSQAFMQQQNYNTNRGYTTAAASRSNLQQEYQPLHPIPSTSRTNYEYQPTHQLQQDNDSQSIRTEISYGIDDYDFDFSKTP